MRKNTLYLIGILILLVSFFAGCGGAQKSTGKAEFSKMVVRDYDGSSQGHDKGTPNLPSPQSEPAEQAMEQRYSSGSDYAGSPRMADQGISYEEYQRTMTPPPSSGGTDVPNKKPYDMTYYESYGVNPFVSTEDEKFSTFGMDVDTASYTIARRYLTDGNMPEKESIRTEEFINYFPQNYPDSEDSFTISVEGAESEFGRPNYHLLKIGVKARDIPPFERKPANMVFVVDVSGSMNREDRLEQVKRSLTTLSESLRDGDEIGLVVYGSNGQVISDLTGDHQRIMQAISQLHPDGSTNAEEGLTLAYNMATQHFNPNKINRIILCSDGVANVGVTGADEILKNIKSQSEKGITLTTIGFGMGNYNDVLMEKLANHGDGGYYYIDSPQESDKVFGRGAVSLLQALASDAKIQVEFNPQTVDRYRLLGYENRRLNKEDFEDDTVDAGEVGAGQTVTALYEIRIKDNSMEDSGAPVATVRIRYMNTETHRIETNQKSIDVSRMTRSFDSASPEFRFDAAVAEFAELLKQSYWAKDGSYSSVIRVAESAINNTDAGYRSSEYREFIDLVKRAKEIAGDRLPDNIPIPRFIQKDYVAE